MVVNRVRTVLTVLPLASADMSEAKTTRCVFKCRVEIGQRHRFIPPDAVYERLELRFIRMVADITRINERGLKRTPFTLIHPVKFRGIDAIIKQASLTSDEMDMEVIRL